MNRGVFTIINIALEGVLVLLSIPNMLVFMQEMGLDFVYLSYSTVCKSTFR